MIHYANVSISVAVSLRFFARLILFLFSCGPIQIELLSLNYNVMTTIREGESKKE